MQVQNDFLDVFIFAFWINIKIGPTWVGFQNETHLAASYLSLVGQ